MKRTKKVTVQFYGGSAIARTLHIPAGLRVSLITKGSGAGKTYFLEELPEDMFPKDSIVRHDADHYGVVLNENQVEEVK